MSHSLKRIFVIALFSPLAACSSGKDAGPASDLTLADTPASKTYTATAHKGLESFVITNGAAVNAGTEGPVGSTQASPTASITTSTSGFNLKLPDGNNVKFGSASDPLQISGTPVFNGTVDGGTNRVAANFTNGAASPLSYSTYGTWLESDANGIPLVAGVVAVGAITPTSDVPTLGKATYNGNISGYVFTPTRAANITSGVLALTVDFGGNSVGGVVTSILTSDMNKQATGVMSAIYLSGGTISGAGFSGNATAAPPCDCTNVDISGATGTFGGKFYGPGASEVAGSIALAGAGNTVLASFGAKKN